MNPVFADTSFYIALVSPGDVDHARAVELIGRGFSKIITTEYVLVEVGDGLADRHNRSLLLHLLRTLQADRAVRICPASSTLFNRGVALDVARGDKEWSLTDCLSFVVMQDEGLELALTGDHHFEQAGFVALMR